MNAFSLSRRDTLRALATAPLLSVAARAERATPSADRGRLEDFAAALADDPRLLAFANPSASQLAAPLTTVAGKLPPELTGVLWRNGPAEHERFGHRYGHWFDGDGMLQAFAFDGAGVTHRARVLDTRKRRLETRLGRRALPAFGTVVPDPAPVSGPDDMNVANTSVLAHAGRLMALWEGGSAVAVDAETLAAGKPVHWREDVAGLPFSAHPKRDADGTLWNIGVLAGQSSMLLFYRIDRAGRLAGFGHLPYEPLGMVHDFVITARHLVLLVPPFVLEPGRLAAGRSSYLDAHVWRPELGTRALVVDKESLAPVRRHELPAGFHFHHGNGWEEGDGTIHLDVCQAPDPHFLTLDLRAPMRGAWRFPSTHPRYRRVTLGPGGDARIEDATPGTTDFPRVDPRRVGVRHGMVFALNGADPSGGDDTSNWALNAVARVHPDGGDADRWPCPPHQIPEEHVFVPRGAAEGDGWLLGPFLDVARRASGLRVFDAAHVADGPLWEGMLPYPLPHALHGTFSAS